MFSRSPRKHAPEIDTLIGRNTRVEGDIDFSGGCHVDGQVKGCIRGNDDEDSVLSISDTGMVEGSVIVPQLILNGTVQGDVRVTGRIELGASARVVGNLFYNLIEMAIGAEVNGQLIHSEASAGASPVLVTHQDTTAGADAGKGADGKSRSAGTAEKPPSALGKQQKAG
ncbi:MAG: polymer-forming cytoskeletal protein [Pseudomonadota bacterium]